MEIICRFILVLWGLLWIVGFLEPLSVSECCAELVFRTCAEYVRSSCGARAEHILSVFIACKELVQSGPKHCPNSLLSGHILIRTPTKWFFIKTCDAPACCNHA